MKGLVGSFATIAVMLLHAQTAGAAVPCERLSAMTLPNATITLAQTVPAGGLTLPDAPPNSGPPLRGLSELPAFCRVAATLKPSADSDIKIEVWMPATQWNGKFEAVGNGGWSGAIVYGPLATALGRHYASASTDTGHTGATGEFALGHPEKLIDFGYRAVHEMTVQAKAIISAFYGNGPSLSYWNGCSSGGKQGLKEAQRFPNDYDGIIAGAPANFWTHLVASSMWASAATLKDASSYIPREKYALIHKAVLDACDARDGIKDGVIDDPTRCTFDPNVLKCADQDGPSCLTAGQVEAARKIYAGPSNPRTGQQIFPGLEPGSELGWGAMAGGPQPFGIANDHFKYVVFKDPNWDFRSLNFDRDVDLADRMDDGLLNATLPDLRPFFGHGGKLLLYHGWNDQLIAPRNTIQYVKSLEAMSGGAEGLTNSARLFMVPGMTHCAGGDGPNTFDALSAMEQWVEQKSAPERIVASHSSGGTIDRTRPLCVYPKVARYVGTGSTDDAANFVCAIP
jgi:tannase/feruloyl esterase